MVKACREARGAPERRPRGAVTGGRASVNVLPAPVALAMVSARQPTSRGVDAPSSRGSARASVMRESSGAGCAESAVGARDALAPASDGAGAPGAGL
jgi:hypothetical protein